jgi:hypothetical protein
LLYCQGAIIYSIHKSFFLNLDVESKHTGYTGVKPSAGSADYSDDAGELEHLDAAPSGADYSDDYGDSGNDYIRGKDGKLG